MLAHPSISVLMPVYNAEKYLAEAIQSILDQSYRNFELLIIEDGSTDCSAKIAAEFERCDARIRLIRQSENQGLVTALNLGLDLAQGEYIARMDADDISLPERLEKQVEYMQAHPEIGVLGGKIQYMNEDGQLATIPLTFYGDINIRWNLLFTNPFSHPAVMMRKAIIERYRLRYDPRATHVEDYEFWGRFLLVAKGENFPDVLLHYRLHPGSVGDTYGKTQNMLAAQISCEIIRKHLPDVEASLKEIKHWTELMWGFASLDFYDRARWMISYLKIWNTFYRINKGNPGLAELRKKLIPWVALYSIYPFFQPGWMTTVRFMTKIEWRWPFLLISKLPYFYANRRRMSFFKMESGYVDTQ